MSVTFTYKEQEVVAPAFVDLGQHVPLASVARMSSRDKEELTKGSMQMILSFIHQTTKLVEEGAENYEPFLEILESMQVDEYVEFQEAWSGVEPEKA